MVVEGQIARLLSHRLRGFDSIDSTRTGLERGLAAGAHHVEFDIRFTKDAHPVAHHNPFFKCDDGSWQPIDVWSLSDLREQRAMHRLATLEEMCGAFVAFRRADTLLHIDIKVAGREQFIFDMIAKFDLLDQTVLVSWLPSILTRFNEISPRTRLCFSHLTMARAPWLYTIIKHLNPALDRFVAPVLRSPTGRAIRDAAPAFLQEPLATRLYCSDDGDPLTEYKDNEGARCIHAHIIPGMLSRTMLDLLRRTRGIVCIPTPLASRSLGQAYHAQGIQLAVFSVKRMSTLARILANVVPDLIYVDDASLFSSVANRRTV